MGTKQAPSLLSKLYHLPITSKTRLISWFGLGALVIVVGSGGIILRKSLESQKFQEVESQIAVIGTLVKEDLVKKNFPIVQKTVAAFTDNGDYSTVYLPQSTGEFSLINSLSEAAENSKLPTLSTTSILHSAVDNRGRVVTEQANINNETYSLAAQAITNNNQETIAVIVYGRVRNSAVFWTNIGLQMSLSGLVIAATLWLTDFLGRAITEPIQELQQITQDFAEGDLKARAPMRTNDEVALLASTFNQLADSIAINENKLREDAKKSQILQKIALNFGEALEPEAIVKLAVEDSRQVLNSDRVIYYTFDQQWQGTIIAESVQDGYPVASRTPIQDPGLADQYLEKYRSGEVHAIADVSQAGFSESELQQLESWAVKANLVIPVLIGEKLTGLLVVHQCDSPREWQIKETELLIKIAIQTGNALEKAELLQRQKQSQEKERQAKEKLQRRALELLMEVDPVSQGDLTIRAQIKEDEIGTIADSYNATIESLRKLVTQVQSAAALVSTTTSAKETAIQELSQGASEQTQEITKALGRIQAMTNSIQVVASNAEAAEKAVRLASDTVQAGDEVMNRTVDGFSAIRETVAETAKKVKRLGESSQKISKVVNLISSFADQTNLLALNASIEAAHAGEEGRGFAVVADEVRSLARQSAEATADIESLVAEIQAETNEVVAAMESGTEQVVAGTKLVDETRSSLNHIAQVSSQIDELVITIAQATVEQSKDSEIVSQTMAQVAAVSEKTATEALQVSDSFKELLTVAQELQASVSKFKVN
ncbi:MAG: methyl-accepting chemotaxis protein [Xenococcus sp. MO_188.B8]|nr:methyl-accepting chemotaxis protein [Xenococcus sp. MO_188.B8]